MALPSMDTAPHALRGCFSPAIFWADCFWNSQLDRCSVVCTLANAAPAFHLFTTCHHFLLLCNNQPRAPCDLKPSNNLQAELSRWSQDRG